jgi:hypothetical protein
MQQANFQQ